MRLRTFIAIMAGFYTLTVDGPLATAAEMLTRRIDVQVDGERPLAGERSCFAVSPNGEIAFTWTLVAGDHSCKPLGLISADGRVTYSAIDTETTWNVDGWGAYGMPFDLAWDHRGQLHVAARFHGQPYGVDYWYQVNGQWRLETFGQDVTFGGNNVSLEILPDARPVVLCMTRDRTRLAVWERSAHGQWNVSRPEELVGVRPGDFELTVSSDGQLHVLFCPQNGGPVCATRSRDGVWSRVTIADVPVCRWTSADVSPDGVLNVAFASGARNAAIQKLHHGRRGVDGRWSSRVIATAEEDRHVGRTDITGLAGRAVIAWEQGDGPVYVGKDYGGQVGSVELTVVDGSQPPTTKTLAETGGRPSLAVSLDEQIAWIGVYSGNDAGDDFFVLAHGLDSRNPPAVQADTLDPEAVYAIGCLHDVNSGNELAQRRGMQRLDMSQLESELRFELIDRFLESPDDAIRLAVVRELAKDATALQRMDDRQRLAALLKDSNRLVRKTLFEHLSSDSAVADLIQTLAATGLQSTDAMNRLSSAETIRLHPEWPVTDAIRDAVTSLLRDLGNDDRSRNGSAAMALERLAHLEPVVVGLTSTVVDESPQRAPSAATVLWRIGEEFDVQVLRTSIAHNEEVSALATCGLLGQMRLREGVEVLKTALNSSHATVRSAAVYALRSTAHVAELKGVAKHPRGFDLLALRVSNPSTKAEQSAQDAALNVLEEALDHEDPNVREKSADALGRAGAKRALPRLIPLLDDADPGVRTAATTAISVLKGTPADSLIDLERWTQTASDRTDRRMNPIYRHSTEIQNGVVQVGNDTQLFVDDFLIAEMKGLKRRLHAFQKHARNPVFQAQVPWEEGWADPFMSTVIYDEQQRCFRMWYRCGPRHSLKGYAVSADGIHWQRPDTAESGWGEYKRHNLLGFEGTIAIWKKPGNNVIHDPTAADPERRFQSLFYQHDKTYGLSRSADGIHWSEPESVRPAFGDVVSLVRDPARKGYLFFPKYMRQNDSFTRRSFTAATLQKLDDPFTARFPFLAGMREDALVADSACRAFGSLLPNVTRLSEFHGEVYSVTAIPYEGVVIALYDLWPVIGNREGPLDMPMKVSRDMKNWTDVDFPRRALEIGRFGEWDSGMVYGGNTMLVVDDEIRLYYLGANMGHCTQVLPATKPYHTIGVGLATLRLDGFASLRSESEQSGTVTTHPLKLDGGRLLINADCGNAGHMSAELLDIEGNVIQGFAADDCMSVEGDSLRHHVRWRGVTDLPSSTVRIRFTVRNADLFSFRVAQKSE